MKPKNTDGWKTYEHHLPPGKRQVSKLKMQTIERKHLILRTRIKLTNLHNITKMLTNEILPQS
ncbi:IS1 family transposase [Mastigocoleus sp. MO_188.B34]|uniref:IS1 family transposase n=1 Tax=Mastigocoleus sp. MO_188.B34 TaxID=3036635 RepID=UPI00260A1D28|nr:IS1 family transposase [Mastigocoleus sp. MO_188.B34]MDJ0693499.1 IS1 family transposase [Mastigocoleus sp. MO_188.B34]